MHATLGEPSTEADFLAEARAEIAVRGPHCQVSVIAASLAGYDHDRFLAAVESDIPATAVATAARKRGWGLSYQSVARHRRGLCRCPATTS